MGSGVGICVSISAVFGVAIATSPFFPSLSFLPHSHLLPLASAALPSEPIAPNSIGTLRVQNQSYHPVRVALLPQLSGFPAIAQISVVQGEHASVSSPTTPVTNDLLLPQTDQAQYGDPVHWDFVPREGHEDGLVLALTDGQFWVQPGDIITAFAQDGSRRYWGPYVIGVTDAPVWDEDQREWVLIIDTPFPF